MTEYAFLVLIVLMKALVSFTQGNKILYVKQVYLPGIGN
jgi:hypothetical protein